jgi:cytochrome c oxidase cbb3-type subunit 1
MISSLTVNERQVALLTLGVLAAVGLAMAIGGRGEPLGVHGFIVLVSSICLAFPILARLFDPEPPSSRLQEYYDDPTRIGIVLTMIWAVIGMAASAFGSRHCTSFGRCARSIPAASSSASAATR